MGSLIHDATNHEQLEKPRIAALRAVNADLFQLRERVLRKKVAVEIGYLQLVNLTKVLSSLRPLPTFHLESWATEKGDMTTLRNVRTAGDMAKSWIRLLPAVAQNQTQAIEKTQGHLVDAINYFLENLPQLITAEETLERYDEMLLHEPLQKPQPLMQPQRRVA